MSGGLFTRAFLREIGCEVSADLLDKLRTCHAAAYRVYDDPEVLLRHLDEVGIREA